MSWLFVLCDCEVCRRDPRARYAVAAERIVATAPLAYGVERRAAARRLVYQLARAEGYGHRRALRCAHHTGPALELLQAADQRWMALRVGDLHVPGCAEERAHALGVE